MDESQATKLDLFIAMKKSYTIPCASTFRDEVTQLADQKGVNVGDLARSILLALPTEVIDKAKDPGEPQGDDRETVILKSGPAKGRPWRRKPRLQVRMSDGSNPEQIRKALGLALQMSKGKLGLKLDDLTEAPAQAKAEIQPSPSIWTTPQASPANTPKPATKIALPDPELMAAKEQARAQREEIERMRAVISVLAFDPLNRGVQTREDAFHVLGFPPGVKPSRDTVRARFRMLATIHHPDSPYGSHERMSQLNTAIAMLRDLP